MIALVGFLVTGFASWFHRAWVIVTWAHTPGKKVISIGMCIKGIFSSWWTESRGPDRKGLGRAHHQGPTPNGFFLVRLHLLNFPGPPKKASPVGDQAFNKDL